VYDNTAPSSSEIYKDGPSSPTVTYSDVKGGYSGTGNINADPLFVGGSDYHITSGSPCFNAGTDAGVYIDIDGEGRPMGGRFDMGSDELFDDAAMLIGTYIINSTGSGNYTSFAEAVNALETNGVEGSVRFDIYGGTYSEQVGGAGGIGEISGVSATNYIRFQPAAGETVTIDGDDYGVYINGGDYIEFWKFRITGSTSHGVFIRGDSDYSVIKQCTIDGVGGGAGIRLEGTSPSAAPDNCLIQGNTIDTTAGGTDIDGVGAYYAYDSTIYNNDVLVGSSASGVHLYFDCDGNEISDNTIHGTDASYALDGITLEDGSDDNTTFNNMIYYCYLGIYDHGSATYPNDSNHFYFNSILALSGLWGEYDVSPNIRNNILSCSGTQAGSNHAIRINNASGVTSDYNDLWAPNGYVGIWNGTTCSILAEWRTESGLGANSISQSPRFVSTSDLHIYSSSRCIDSGTVIEPGSPDPQYTYDFDGDVRDGYAKRGSAPDIGADEKDGGGPLFVDFIRFDALALGRDVMLTWTTAEEIDTAGFYLWRSEGEGGEFEKVTYDLIPAHGGPFFGVDYSYLDEGLAVGKTYYYQLEAIDLYGASQWEGPVSVTVGAICGAMAPGEGHGSRLPRTVAALMLAAFVWFVIRRIVRFCK